MNMYSRLRYASRFLIPLALASTTLAVGIVYTIGTIYLVPYTGFQISSQWIVVDVEQECSAVTSTEVSLRQPDKKCNELSESLAVGDQIDVVEIPTLNSRLERSQYAKELSASPFTGVKDRDVIVLSITRDGQSLQVVGTMQKITLQKQLSRLGTSLLFLPFWLAGTVVLLFFRPRNTRWYLMVAFNYVTAIWFVVGLVSGENILLSGILLAPLSWIMASIYLHFHMVLPSPLLGVSFSAKLYWLHIIAGVIALLTVVNIIPFDTYSYALLLGIGSSIVLLFVRFIRPSNPNRTATYLMLTGLLTAMMPGLLWLLPVVSGATNTTATTLAILAIPSLPFFYTYALYKHRLGDTELRANRALMLYSFAVVYATTFVLLFVLFYREPRFDSAALGAALAASAVCQLLAFLTWGPITRLVNRLAYGTTYEPEQLIRHFANTIPRSLSRKQLNSLLETEILPTLLVRQAALFWLTEDKQTLVHATGVDADLSLVTKEQVGRLQEKGKRYLTTENVPAWPFDWARLIVPIEVDKQVIGVWVFGRRDPDDFYPQSDIDLATTLGNQIALAMETIRLFEAVQTRAREMERLNLELRRADRLKSDLLRNVTHELRTPLTTIHGFTELMIGDENLNDDHQEYLNAIIHSTQSLVQMVNNVLHMQQQRVASLQEGQRVDLRQIAEQCIERAQILADRDAIWREQPHHIRLTAPKIPFWVWGESVQLSYVFDNLLSNAVKFSPAGGAVQVRLWIDLHEFEQNDDVDADLLNQNHRTSGPQPAIFASVQDEGIGIATTELDNIWLEFYQIDLSETRQYGGTGIGLALVKEIVEAFSGEVWVESTSEKGSTFVFALPAHQALSTDSSMPTVTTTIPEASDAA